MGFKIITHLKGHFHATHCGVGLLLSAVPTIATDANL